MTVWGYTGTRDGVTEEQLLMGLDLMGEPTEWHFGDAPGGDSQMHYMIADRFWPRVRIISHPCRLPLRCSPVTLARDPKPPLVRNRDIVDETKKMVAMPRGYKEELRGSGTWMTIRYARKLGRPLFIVWPNGSVN